MFNVRMQYATPQSAGGKKWKAVNLAKSSSDQSRNWSKTLSLRPIDGASCEGQKTEISS